MVQQQNDQEFYDDFEALGGAQDEVDTALPEKKQSTRQQAARQKIVYGVVFVFLCGIVAVGWMVFGPKPQTAPLIEPIVDQALVETPQQATLPEAVKPVETDTAKSQAIAAMPAVQESASDALSSVSSTGSQAPSQPVPANEKVIEVAQDAPSQTEAVNTPVDTPVGTAVTATALPTPVTPTNISGLPAPSSQVDAPQANTQPAMPTPMTPADAVTTDGTSAPNNALIAQPTEQVAETQAPPLEAASIETKQEATTEITPSLPMVASALPQPTAVASLPQPTIQAQTTTAPTVMDPATQQRMMALEEQIKSLATRVETPSDKTNVGSANQALLKQLEVISEQLEKIEAQADALDQRTTSLASEMQEQVQRKEVTPEPVKEKEAVTEKPKTQPQKTVVKPVQKPKAVTAKPAAPMPQWELRSAQPGVAWLGRKGSGEMTRYAVGETVPGLGQITSVTQDAAGRWAVRGTNGAVFQ